MKFCFNCGKKIKQNVHFCPYCGARQRVNSPKRSVNSQTTQPPRYAFNNDLNSQFQIITPGVKKRVVPPRCSFIKAFKLFWKNYVNFDGYSSRAEFWWWFLIEYIIDTLVSAHVSSVLSRAGVSLFGAFTGNDVDAALPIDTVASALGIAIIWYLIVLIPNLSLRARRFRDAGMSNGWIIAILICDYLPWVIPIFGWIVSIAARIATLVFELMPSVRTVHSNMR